jgi:ATP-dependent DNA helicase RecG
MILFYGKAIVKKDKVIMNQPSFEKYGVTEFSTILSKYKRNKKLELRGIKTGHLKLILKNLINDPDIYYEDIFPEWVLKKYNLMNIKDALHQIHFPKSIHSLYDSEKRIKFQELLIMQLYYSKLKFFRNDLEKENIYKNKSIEINELIENNEKKIYKLDFKSLSSF